MGDCAGDTKQAVGIGVGVGGTVAIVLIFVGAGYCFRHRRRFLAAHLQQSASSSQSPSDTGAFKQEARVFKSRTAPEQVQLAVACEPMAFETKNPLLLQSLNKLQVLSCHCHKCACAGSCLGRKT